MNDLVLIILFSAATLAMAIVLGLWIIIRAGAREDRDIDEGALEGDLRNFVLDLNTEQGR